MGQDSLGNKVYIGRGTFSGQLAPGKLLVDASANAYNGIGLYMEFGRAERYFATNFEYYAKEPTCNYKWVQSSNGEVISNAVQYEETSFTFYVGKAVGTVEVGKMALELGTLYYGKGFSTQTYEVLVCEPK